MRPEAGVRGGGGASPWGLVGGLGMRRLAQVFPVGHQRGVPDWEDLAHDQKEGRPRGFDAGRRK